MADATASGTPRARFAVLGDSLSEGVGDPTPGGEWRGWAALLAEGLQPGADILNLARSGARTGDVAGRQLSAALSWRPTIASVLVGGNDTLRGGFDIPTVATELHTALGALRATGATVLTACLPDPGTVLGLPWPLARPLGRRMTALNDTVHALSAHHGALHLHAAERPWATSPGALSADRLHPSEAGHRMLAADFHALLAGSGMPVGAPPRLEPDGPPPGRAASVCWMATRGTKWIADRCTDLLPDLLRLAAEEYRHTARGTAPLLDHAAREATAAALESLGLSAARAHVPPTVPAPLHSAGRPERSATKRILVPGADWAAAASDSSGTTPITG
ncbi:SGNH/GDSL hydrolase family protein [Actinacidiphila bryophytorum]|uniref:SGNH/GDSL hydrolase family protein n=1 Tax=Actinacidiphila bryophytorum TaxID=1436133 RepID=UPI00197F149A|nr:SGNH/GDSL hydrolase family protein [Actinacidiphila bryophytorum]MBN6547123.1 SGNH/GDSL hydrolase family protein [Actinacidiphila bryophytorum]